MPSELDRTPAPAAARPALWRMAGTNLALGATVFVVWFVLGGDRALQAVANHWQVSLTMVFGSLVGGGTSEGGGAIAFPVMTKVLAVPAPQARLIEVTEVATTERGEGGFGSTGRDAAKS